MATRHRSDIPPMDVLSRLADALDTTLDELMLHAPAAWYQPAAAAFLHTLDETECRRLLATEEVGRVAFIDGGRPGVLPVTYGLFRGRPVFRTTGESVLGRVTGQRVAFEVDRTDRDRREGWSVVVTGCAHAVVGQSVNLDGTAVVEPWPGGARDLYIALDPESITGRRIVHAGAGA